MRLNNNEEKTIKQLKESIDLLKKENKKLKLENKNISSLKETIIKLQEEKMELSRKIIEMESEAVLYNDEENKDEMLYNPRRASRLSTISQKDLIQKLQPNSSNFNLSNKKLNNDFNKITNSNFSIISNRNKNLNILKDGLKNKNEEILLLKNELIKKEKTILELKKNMENYNNIFDSKYSLNNSKNNSNNKSNNDNLINKKTPEDYLGILSRRFSFKKIDSKEINDSIYEENEAHLLLEKNIYSEIQNILEEKRNFILKTLTCENFSFDILNDGNYKNKKSGELAGDDLNGSSIEQILALIRQRKKKVEMTKKYLEEKIV